MIHPLRTLRYAGWLGTEVVKGALLIARDIATRRSLLAPAIVELPLRCVTDLEVSLFASSITITPGTVTLGIAAAHDEHPPTLFVHAFFGQDTEQVRADLRDMEHRVLRMTRGPHAPDPEGPPCPTAAPEAGGPVGAARHTDDRTKEAT